MADLKNDVAKAKAEYAATFQGLEKKQKSLIAQIRQLQTDLNQCNAAMVSVQGSYKALAILQPGPEDKKEVVGKTP